MGSICWVLCVTCSRICLRFLGWGPLYEAFGIWGLGSGLGKGPVLECACSPLLTCSHGAVRPSDECRGMA